ncbi:MAG: tetratricopeptide repeat protein [Treponema sp.]|jgi:tetratricopeptide (TPR) repeat protein|nr:tetratricopeptide repeat protein [Treponema sp.]
MKKLAWAALFCLAAAIVFAQDAEFYYNWGIDRYSAGDLDGAIVNWTEAIRLNPDYATAYSNRGTAYYAKGSLDLAIADWTEAIRLNPDLYQAYYNRGNAYYDKGSLDRAVADYTAALASNPEYTEAYNNRGNAYRNKGDLDAAIANYTAALALNPEYATAYNNRGVAYKDTGNMDAAIADFTTALALNPEYAAAYNNRGNAYRNKGDLDAAIADFTAALASNPKYAEAYNNRGIAHYTKDDLDAAIADYTAALALNSSLAEIYTNRGAAYKAKGDLDAAIADYTTALALNPENAESYSNRGNAYTINGNMNAAEADYHRSIEAAARSGNMGNMLDIFHRAWEFTGFLYKDYPFLEDIPGGYAVLQANLAREALGISIAKAEKARADLGSRGTALRGRLLYQYYAAVDLEAVVGSGSADLAFFYSESLRNRGFLEQLGTEAALRLGGVDADNARQVRALSTDIENMQGLLTTLDPRTEGNRYAEAVRRLNGLETELAALEERIVEDLSPAEKIRYTQLRNPRPVSAEEARSWCPEDTAVLEYVLWDDTVDFAAPASSTGQSAYQDRPLINSYCLVLTKDGIIPVTLGHGPIDEENGYDYAGDMRFLRQNLVNQLEDIILEPYRNRLYDYFIKPVLPHVPGIVTRLLIVPAGDISKLPFDILRQDKDSPNLGERYRLSLSPSVSVSVLAQKTGAPVYEPVIAFGGARYNEDPEYSVDRVLAGLDRSGDGSTWKNLPGTVIEVEGLRGLSFSKAPRLYLGEAVTESLVKELSNNGTLRQYPVLHFACHGFFDELDSSQSGIVFSEVSGVKGATEEDGYLRIREVVLLNLNTRMTILSACETGLSENRQGEGMIGLVRAFLVAGSENMGVSLWKVNDQETRDFMLRVYRKVIDEKKTFAGAYHEVKEEYRQAGRHPYFWAAFVLYE